MSIDHSSYSTVKLWVWSPGFQVSKHQSSLRVCVSIEGHANNWDHEGGWNGVTYPTEKSEKKHGELTNILRIRRMIHPKWLGWTAPKTCCGKSDTKTRRKWKWKDISKSSVFHGKNIKQIPTLFSDNPSADDFLLELLSHAASLLTAIPWFLSLRYAALSLLAHAAVCKRSWQPPRFPDNDTSSAFCRACNEGWWALHVILMMINMGLQ